jgi:intracellular septation protein A
MALSEDVFDLVGERRMATTTEVTGKVVQKQYHLPEQTWITLTCSWSSV